MHNNTGAGNGVVDAVLSARTGAGVDIRFDEEHECVVVRGVGTEVGLDILGRKRKEVRCWLGEDSCLKALRKTAVVPVPLASRVKVTVKVEVEEWSGYGDEVSEWGEEEESEGVRVEMNGGLDFVEDWSRKHGPWEERSPCYKRKTQKQEMPEGECYRHLIKWQFRDRAAWELGKDPKAWKLKRLRREHPRWFERKVAVRLVRQGGWVHLEAAGKEMTSVRRIISELEWEEVVGSSETLREEGRRLNKEGWRERVEARKERFVQDLGDTERIRYSVSKGNGAWVPFRSQNEDENRALADGLGLNDLRFGSGPKPQHFEAAVVSVVDNAELRRIADSAWPSYLDVGGSTEDRSCTSRTRRWSSSQYWKRRTGTGTGREI